MNDAGEERLVWRPGWNLKGGGLTFCGRVARDISIRVDGRTVAWVVKAGALGKGTSRESL